MRRNVDLLDTENVGLTYKTRNGIFARKKWHITPINFAASVC